MTYLPTDDDRENTMRELAWEDKQKRTQLLRLIANPDCRDPDHPGCSQCNEESEEDDE